MTDHNHRGRCECGAVCYQVSGALRNVVNCHCKQCQRTHGNYAAYTAAKKKDFMLLNQEGLKWYHFSEQAKRGFCQQCGASLFWQSTDQDFICIDAGTLDAPTQLSTVGHIFVASAGDYYQASDDLPKMPEGLGDKGAQFGWPDNE